MRIPVASAALILAASLATLHCGGSSNGGVAGPDAGATPPPGDAGDDPGPAPLTSSSKIDVLFVVDDSASMADKAGLLADSLGTLLRRLATPSCVDAQGRVVGVSAGGACASGALEFAPIADAHVGVITSSLGSMGGDVCPNGGNFNRLAHLQTSGPGGAPVASAARGFLSYGAGGTADVDALVADAQALVRGVGEAGCGFEAQLEAAYRFLVQPDPWKTVSLDTRGLADLVDVDVELLQQRAAFLRPDSLVAVVMISDEDDSAVDPRALGGQGWAFEANRFPGSPIFRADSTTTTAPRGTSACAQSPGSPDCTSCALAAVCDTASAACQKIGSDPTCVSKGTYLGAAEDPLNVRFHRMKERYGIDPQFPLSRYTDGFTNAKVPSRDGEHTVQGGVVGPYVGAATCRNPLFAATLPSARGEELCDRPRGARPADFVFFTFIGGVPGALLERGPSWKAILGASPETYDFSGIDPHMIASTTPRPGLSAPSSTRGDNGVDPMSGREWDTGGEDLQYACTFALPAPRTCASNAPSCDCGGARNPPLCGATLGAQVRGKAYPTTRELRVAKGLGERAVVGSICAPDATVAYRPIMNALVDRLAPKIQR